MRLLGPPWVHGGEGGGDGGWVCYVFGDGGELGNPLLGVLGMLVEMGKVVVKMDIVMIVGTVGMVVKVVLAVD